MFIVNPSVNGAPAPCCGPVQSGVSILTVSCFSLAAAVWHAGTRLMEPNMPHRCTFTEDVKCIEVARQRLKLLTLMSPLD